MITTNTHKTITALINIKTDIKELNDKHITKRQAFYDAVLTDIYAIADGENLKPVAQEYMRELDLYEDLAVERTIVEYVALNSNIPNTTEYKTAVKLMKFNPTNSQLNKAKDMKSLVKQMQLDYNKALLETNAKFVDHMSSKTLDEISSILETVQLLKATAIKDAKKA